VLSSGSTYKYFCSLYQTNYSEIFRQRGREVSWCVMGRSTHISRAHDTSTPATVLDLCDKHSFTRSCCFYCVSKCRV